MARRRRRKSGGGWIGLLLVGGLIALAIWYFNQPVEPIDPNAPTHAATQPAGGGVPSQVGVDPNADPNTRRVRPRGELVVDQFVPRMPKLNSAQAMEAYRRSLRLRGSGKLIAERDLLNRAYFSGRLGPQSAADARSRLEYLASSTILSDRVFDADPYDMTYMVQRGDTLEGRRGIERTHELHVPSQMIVRINRMPSATALRAGKPIKLIKGPFHAIVDKSEFTMDLFVQREGLEPVYVRRLIVGLGRNDRTPVGLWRVDPAKKLQQADWNPPLTAGVDQRIIRWGDPNYPLGTRGYWIGLEGIERKTQFKHGFGIHGTNDPSSIGRAASLGCIRLTDEDIDFIYGALYVKYSTVTIRE